MQSQNKRWGNLQPFLILDGKSLVFNAGISYQHLPKALSVLFWDKKMGIILRSLQQLANATRTELPEIP